MSEVIASPFKKPKCGDMFNLGGMATTTIIKDAIGGMVDILVVGTDPDVTQPIVGTAMTDDYCPGEEVSTVNPGVPRVNPDKTFFICIETAGAFAVVLSDGTQFMITAVQAAAYLGHWYPARIYKVLMTGTTGDFSVGY
ncbi:MAG: hypothetical protein ABFC18_03490 [Rikenellaceae bacterium]